MSRQPRRNHPLAFKAKVAIEALGDDKTIADIAHRHDLNLTIGDDSCWSGRPASLA